MCKTASCHTCRQDLRSTLSKRLRRSSMQAGRESLWGSLFRGDMCYLPTLKTSALSLECRLSSQNLLKTLYFQMKATTKSHQKSCNSIIRVTGHWGLRSRRKETINGSWTPLSIGSGWLMEKEKKEWWRRSKEISTNPTSQRPRLLKRQ